MDENFLYENQSKESSLYEPPDALARLDLETEQLMDSVQTFLKTPPPNKQTAGQSSSPDIVHSLDFDGESPSDDAEEEQKDSSSPFVPTGDLLNLQNETDEMMDSMKSSLMTPPPGFQKIATQHEKNPIESPLLMSPFAPSADLAKLRNETEDMMDSIKSSLMTPRTKVNDNFEGFDTTDNSNRDSIDSSGTYNPPEDSPLNVSFFSDDGINEEIHTLDEAIPNLKEDLHNINESTVENEQKEDNVYSSEDICTEEVHKTVEEADDEVEKEMDSENETASLVEEVIVASIRSSQDNEQIDSSIATAIVEERLLKEISLAKEELSKSKELDCTKDEQEFVIGKMVAGSDIDTTKFQSDAYRLDAIVYTNESQSDVIQGWESQKDSTIEMKGDGLIYELAMIPVDLVNFIIESNIARAISNSSAFMFVTSVVKNYPFELLIVIISIYLYRAVKLAFL
jgi:hypothetical protein